MGNSDLTKSSSTSLIDKGIDTLKDPKTSKGAKAGAVALVAIGAVAFLGKAAIDVIGQDKQ